MQKGMIYIHGKDGTAEEAAHYRPLFPDCDVAGLDYRAQTPWDAAEEFPRFFESFRRTHSAITVVANSIGAYFTMTALTGREIDRAFFISPIVNMEKLILDMMRWSGVSEAELSEKGEIGTDLGETLSWEYLRWVRAHPVMWRVPTSILYGGGDVLQSPETVRAFAAGCGADVTVMENGEHWFHTEEQTAFLDGWIRRKTLSV